MPERQGNEMEGTVGRVTVWLVALATGYLLLTEAVGAGFRNNYAQWRELSGDMKYGYAMGQFDWFTTFSPNDEAQIAQAVGVRTCAKELDLTVDMLLEAINAEYSTKLEDWNKPPAVILITVLQRMCRSQINAERAARGLDAISND